MLKIENLCKSFRTEDVETIALGWVIYGEIFLTPIPEIELYIAFEIRPA